MGSWGFAIGSDGTMYVGVAAGVAATKTDGTNVLFEAPCPKSSPPVALMAGCTSSTTRG